MNIEQLIDSKSKQEIAFIMYNKCFCCHHFYENKYGNWNCESSWHEEYCRKNWDNYLKMILDKNNYLGSYGDKEL